MRLAFFLLLLINARLTIAGSSNSLDDCYTLAARFDTTCAVNMTAVPPILSTTGVNVTCTSGFSNSTCPGNWENGTCAFAHKLCVTCSADAPVRIRVQTNGLPRFCPNAPQPISEQNIDFTVNFNPDVNINSLNYNPTSAAELNAIVCNLSSQTLAPSTSNLMINGDSLNTLAAVSIDGVPILNVNSANNTDPFYPPGNISVEIVDTCLGQSNQQNMYHYHIGTACALTKPNGSIAQCANRPSCFTNIANYSISSFDQYRTLIVTGIAKDGHIIYGPYDTTGTEVSMLNLET
ncbi:unnamed protein product [Rotaria sp. Silwood2]|nr:unnamed protein product [Rotaria sp. Silwood2]CAF2684756.1 unnamed protein product [Rotaria sp. Silwood2]CAF3093148.1 unnamed protein product [Rotaria sp. Silwood2]CAF3221767.1 unnamed protein product [Rotaria sp. Silwood2]CAF4100704.1 unnamed protein product [Rotaria sp. Silwood2]